MLVLRRDTSTQGGAKQPPYNNGGLNCAGQDQGGGSTGEAITQGAGYADIMRRSPATMRAPIGTDGHNNSPH
nr:MAG TPA: hypothetical protein [Caudoviricetes sp.]